MTGTVQVSSKAVFVNYSFKYKCGVGSNTWHQELQATFNLTSGKWSQRGRLLVDCLTTADKTWRDDSQGQFRIDPNGQVIRADALDDDGSVINENALIIKQ